MQKILLIIVSAAVLLLGKSAVAQNKLNKEAIDSFKVQENELMKLADSMLYSPIESDRVQYGMRFLKQLKNTLLVEGAYAYTFDSLATKIHILPSPDKTFKIFNWLIATSDWSRVYFGIIQTAQQPQKLIPLLDYSDKMQDSQLQDVLDNKTWFGAEYYNIMQDVYNGKTIYLVFGMNTNSININRKLIDVLYFDADKATAHFGLPIFNGVDQLGRRGVFKRYFIQYKKGASTTLNYDTALKLITLNKLESEIGAPSRLDTYVPAGQMDGFKKEGEMWQYYSNVMGILNLGDGNAPINGVMK